MREFVDAVKERARGEEVSAGAEPGPADHQDRRRGARRDPRRRDPPAAVRQEPADRDHARRPAGRRQDDARGKLALWLKEQGHSPLLVAADLQRPNAVNQLQVDRRAGRASRCSPRSPATASATRCDGRPGRRRGGPAHAARRRHRGHRRPARRRRRDDAAGRGHPRRGEPRRDPVRRRRDDRPGRGHHRPGVPRRRRVRRRRPHQARRRRPRWRGAVDRLGDRQAGDVRLGGREAHRLRPLPPRPDGLAHPRHGRRAHPDRAGREDLRRRAGREDGRQAQRAGRRVHARGLPRADAADPQDGLAVEDHGDAARDGAVPRAARELRRARDRPDPGDHPLDDAGRAATTPRSSTALAGPASPGAPAPRSPTSTSSSTGSSRPAR